MTQRRRRASWERATLAEGSARPASAAVAVPRSVCHNPVMMKLLRLKPGHGEIVLAEGDVEGRAVQGLDARELFANGTCFEERRL